MVIEALALIGNCQISALIDRSGSLVWGCLPRFDSEPVFSRLADPDRGGHFDVIPAEGGKGQQRYVENTNVLETTFESPEGSFRVLDFAPRFWLHGRIFRPRQVFRIVEPLEGLPRIRVRCAPTRGWSSEAPSAVEGSSHIVFDGFGSPLRLTTDLPLSKLSGEPVALTGRRHLVLTWGAPVEEPLPALCDRFLTETVRYWQRWVKHSNIPPQYQREVIRSALSLKLHCFEDTGAIVASMTGGLPGGPGGEETADDRYCWLQDASGALDAFRLLGHFEEREHFVEYLLNVATSSEDLRLAPFYRIDGTRATEEGLWELCGLAKDAAPCAGPSFESEVVGTICGEMVLALAPGFMDQRFSGEISAATRALLERLARKAIETFATWARDGTCACPGGARTFSSLMSWVAADRMARVALHDAPWLHREFAAAAAQMRRAIIDRAWNPDLGTFVSNFDGSEVDPSLLRMAPLRFLPVDDPRLRSTVDAIWKVLGDEPFGMAFDDGWGLRRTPSVAAAFHLVEALAATGRAEEAKSVLLRGYVAFSPLALLSASFDPAGLRMSGNFPHARSHVEFIRAAFSASETWADLV